MSFAPYRRRRKHKPVDISAALAKPASDTPREPMYGHDFCMGWSGSHAPLIARQDQQAVDLCDVPDRPTTRYRTEILYDNRPAGVIWFSRGAWRVTIGPHDYGRFRTYLGARTFVRGWYSGLDIVPWEA